jgi:short-subunit dehydrogenase
LRLNLNAISLLTKYARNAFAAQFDSSSNPEQERFGLINMSSITSVVPYPNLNQYGATKVYDDQFTRSVRDAYFKKNIDSLIV